MTPAARSLPPIEVLPEVGSTNAELAARARAGAPHGAALRALVQTAGRGRRDHRWASPAGGLYLSILVRPHVPPELLPGLPVACALGIVDALATAGVSRARLKWPNDVVVGAAKLAGILVELGSAEAGPFAVCGVGVNREAPAIAPAPGAAVPVSAAPLPPTGLAACMDEGVAVPDLADLAASLRDGVLGSVAAWEAAARPLAGDSQAAARPLAPISAAYNAHLAFTGERVAALPHEGGVSFTGVFRGVDDRGCAEVAADDGAVKHLDASRFTIRPVG